MQRESTTEQTLGKLGDKQKPIFDRYCNEKINFSISLELRSLLSSIPGLDFILHDSDSTQSITASELCRLFKNLNALSSHVNASASVSVLTIKQQVALEQCKLNVMSAVYEHILNQCRAQKEIEIAAKMDEQQRRYQREEESRNVWWKKLISHVGFWIYFAYSVTCEFFGYVAMMAEIIGVASTTLNPITLLFAIPMTLIGAMLYIAFEGTLFGFKLADEEKQRLKLIEEQIGVNDAINSIINDEDYKGAMSADSYRGYAFLAIQFNSSVQAKKDKFHVQQNSSRKGLYWAAFALGALSSLGGGYYAGVTFIAALAGFGVVLTPVAVFAIVGVIMTSLLIAFIFMQAKGLEEIIMPTMKPEQELRDKLDVARVKEQEHYIDKMKEKTLSEKGEAAQLDQVRPKRVRADSVYVRGLFNLLQKRADEIGAPTSRPKPSDTDRSSSPALS